MGGKKRFAKNKRKTYAQKQAKKQLSRKDIKYIKEHGELPSKDDGERPEKYRKVVDGDDATSSEEEMEQYGSSGAEEDQPTAYQELLSVFNIKQGAIGSGSESEDDDDSNEELEEDSDVDDDNADEDLDELPADIDDVEGGEDDDNDEDDDDRSDSGDVDNENDDNEGDTDEERVDESDEATGSDEEETEAEDSMPHGENSTDVLAENEVEHFHDIISESLADNANDLSTWTRTTTNLTLLGSCVNMLPKDAQPPQINLKNKDLLKLGIKQRLVNQLKKTNQEVCSTNSTGDLSSEQYALLNAISSHQDVLYTQQTHKNRQQHRVVYTLHAMNHVLKSRRIVMAHNEMLRREGGDTIDNDGLRDQGFTRPKVLILAPTREACLQIVNIMCSLMFVNVKQSYVLNQKKFLDEYKVDEQPSYKSKPEDFQAIHSGNNNDHFRLGISVSKNTLKLYTDFYKSDIIIASLIALRDVIEVRGKGTREEDLERDFLSSIELLILDHADMFLMQNWDQLLFINKYLNLLPKETHGEDIFRVKMWLANKWAPVYRQTLIFSNIVSPTISSFFNRYCKNYAGKLIYSQPIEDIKGSICQVLTHVPQIFQRIPATSVAEAANCRFNYFVEKVLPQLSEQLMRRTVVFIPSYFDYVRIRNHLYKESITFGQLSEHTVTKLKSKIRSKFFHNKLQLLLYTERLHFYYRYNLRGVRHLVIYELPQYAHYYAELCNMIDDSDTPASVRRAPDSSSSRKKTHLPSRSAMLKNHTCTILYSKYDMIRLRSVVGAERAAKMMQSNKDTHMFVSGDT